MKWADKSILGDLHSSLLFALGVMGKCISSRDGLLWFYLKWLPKYLVHEKNQKNITINTKCLCVCVRVCVQAHYSLSTVWLFVTPRTVVCQVPLSMEFSRQEHWSRLPFPTPGINLPDPRIEPGSFTPPALQTKYLYHQKTDLFLIPLDLILATGTVPYRALQLFKADTGYWPTIPFPLAIIFNDPSTPADSNTLQSHKFVIFYWQYQFFHCNILLLSLLPVFYHHPYYYLCWFLKHKDDDKNFQMLCMALNPKSLQWLPRFFITWGSLLISTGINSYHAPPSISSWHRT